MKNILNQDARIVKVLTKPINLLSVILLLSSSLVNTQAKRMDEAACSPRPVAVAVTKGHEVLPYHVLLHRCSGTCHNTSPHVKACNVKDSVEIDLEVTDINNKKKIVKVTNHTSCQCRCNCKPNEITLNSDSCKCQCIENCNPSLEVPVSSGARKNDEQKAPIPYLIAIVGVGTFAIIVFLFDAIMYFKGKGFFHSIRHHNCCISSNPEKNEGPMLEQQVFSYPSCNGNCKHTEV